MKNIFRYTLICTVLAGAAGWSVEPVFKNATVIPSGSNIPVKEGAVVKLQPEPYIQNFSLRHQEGYSMTQPKLDVLRGVSSQAVFAWNVQPGTPASPITQIRLSRTMGSGPNLNTTLNNPVGNALLSVPEDAAVGETVYTLTAINEAGNFKSATTILNVMNVSTFGSQLSISKADMDHSAEASAFDFRFNLLNPTTVDVPVTVNISVVAQGSTEPVRISNTMAGKIKAGTSVFVIPNCVIPHPSGYVWNNLVITVKLQNGTSVRQFMVPLQNTVVRTYWVPGT